MDRQRVDLQVIAIPPPNFHYHVPPEVGADFARIQNDALIDLSDKQPDRFHVFATLPLQDIAASLAEIERVAAFPRVRGVQIGSNIDGTDVDDPSLEPVWAGSGAAGLPGLVPFGSALHRRGGPDELLLPAEPDRHPPRVDHRRRQVDLRRGARPAPRPSDRVHPRRWVLPLSDRALGAWLDGAARAQGQHRGDRPPAILRDDVLRQPDPRPTLAGDAGTEDGMGPRPPRQRLSLRHGLDRPGGRCGGGGDERRRPGPGSPTERRALLATAWCRPDADGIHRGSRGLGDRPGL